MDVLSCSKHALPGRAAEDRMFRGTFDDICATVSVFGMSVTPCEQPLSTYLNMHCQKQAARKLTPQKPRQGQLCFHSSQEERKGGLSLSLSQPAETKAASKPQTQSTLQFKPLPKDAEPALASSQVPSATDCREARTGFFKGFGSHSQGQKAHNPSGMLHALSAACLS